MLSSANAASRAPASDHPPTSGAPRKKSYPKRYVRAPHVACAVAAAVAVALFSARRPAAAAAAAATAAVRERPDAAAQSWSRLVAAVLRDLPHRGPDGAARRGPPAKKEVAPDATSPAIRPPEQRHPPAEGARAQGRLPRPRAALHGRHPGPHADLRRLRLAIHAAAPRTPRQREN